MSKAMSEFQSPQKAAPTTTEEASQEGRTMAAPAFTLGRSDRQAAPTDPPPTDRSARFKGDKSLASIFDGLEVIKKGDSGIKVTILQQGLVDAGYALPLEGVSGKFNDETEAVLKKFQGAKGIAATGEFDKATIVALDSHFDSRKSYLNAASGFDKKNPTKGTRKLDAAEKKSALDALKPQPGVAGKTFDPKDGPNYVAELKAMLTKVIPETHQSMYLDKVDLRKDPAKNFHKNSDLEGAANAGKVVTDQVYGDLAKGPAYKMGVNLKDQWKEQEQQFGMMSKKDKKTMARYLVEYYIDTDGGEISSKYNADPSGAEEAKILKPLIESFIDTEDKVRILNETDLGWPGTESNGTQNLQVFKDKSKEENRIRLWRLFHVSIHEYIHTLAHPDYNAWLDTPAMESQRHGLVEGFCDFFTLNVRAKFPAPALKGVKKQVEGDFHDPVKPVPNPDDIGVGVYPSHEQAERMVGIIGIRNAQLGYFRGKTELMGA
jgi:peptidoglycan hydrolase-like protein with peptidoglycan-binding domain